MLRNKIGPIFKHKKARFFVVFAFFWCENSSSFCKENEIFEYKKERNGPVCNTKKRQILDQLLTLQHGGFRGFLMGFRYVSPEPWAWFTWRGPSGLRPREGPYLEKKQHNSCSDTFSVEASWHLK